MKWHEMMKTHQGYKQIQTRSAGMDGCWVFFYLWMSSSFTESKRPLDKDRAKLISLHCCLIQSNIGTSVVGHPTNIGVHIICCCPTLTIYPWKWNKRKHLLKVFLGQGKGNFHVLKSYFPLLISHYPVR